MRKRLKSLLRTLTGITRPLTPKELIKLGTGLIEFDMVLGIGPR